MAYTPVFPNVIALALQATCLISFGWGIVRFFRQPAVARNAGMSFIAFGGIAMNGFNAVQVAFYAPGALQAAVACALMALALLLFWGAIAAHAKNRPVAVFAGETPGMITTRGPYRIVRHPFYVSYILAWLGMAVATWHWASLAMCVLMTAVYAAAAHHEERAILAGPAGHAYAEYAARTGGFVPRLTRLFSPRLACLPRQRT
jgi:protein-S-isoprenylcysteine O-methyltransferase Ste14